MTDARVEETVGLLRGTYTNPLALRRVVGKFLTFPGYTPDGVAKIIEGSKHLRSLVNKTEAELGADRPRVVVVRQAQEPKARTSTVEKVSTGDKTRDSYYNALPKEIRMKVFKEGRDPRLLYKELRSTSKEEMIKKYG